MPTDCCVGNLTCHYGLSDDVRLSWLDSGDFPYFGIIILKLRIWLLSSYKRISVKLSLFHMNVHESVIVLEVDLSVF